jgi:uncharacterized membrane protein
MIEMPAHLHPMVIHFPIALFIMALVFETISLIFKNESLRQAAIYMYVTSALIMPLVIRTGIWEAQKLGLRHPILDKHSQYAIGLMWLSLMSIPILWFINKEFQKYFKAALIIFFISSAVLVSLVGDKGGKMVFEYGVGVEE